MDDRWLRAPALRCSPWYQDKANRLDLFQMDQPAREGQDVRAGVRDDQAHSPTRPFQGDVRVISGRWNEHAAPPAPQASWANDPEHEVAYILTVKPGGRVELDGLGRRESHDVPHRRRKRRGGRADAQAQARHAINAHLPTVIEAKEEQVRVLVLKKSQSQNPWPSTDPS